MKSKRFSGFSLVEVSLALGVAAFCLVAVFSLLPVGLNMNRESIEQSKAMNTISAVAADLQSTLCGPGMTGTSAQYGLVIPAASNLVTTSSNTLFVSEEGLLTAANTARYRVQCWIVTKPGTVQNLGSGPVAPSRNTTLARLLLTWPATAPTTNAAGKAETVLALDCN